MKKFSSLFTFLFTKLKTIPRLIKKRWRLSLVLFVIIIGIVFWQYNQVQSNKPQLTFQKVERKDITKTIEVSGIIDAKQRATMRFIAGGKLTYLGFQEGEFVKKNQTIAQIDASTLKKHLQQDLNLYMKERWDWEDTQDQYDYHVEDLATRKAIDQEQWDLENKVLSVEIRDIAIRDTRLTAPFTGVLTHSPADVAGVQLLATDTFEMINPDTLIFRATIDEEDIKSIQKNQPTTIELDAYEEEELKSNISYISYNTSQSTTGTVFLIEMPLNSTNLDKYRLGMNGDVTIFVDKKEDVLVIPFDATIERDGEIMVNVRTGEDTYEEKIVKTGIETEDEIEIIAGLEAEYEILLPE